MGALRRNDARRRVRFGCAVLAAGVGSALLFGWATGSAQAAKPPLTPPGFTLRASNGYTLSAFATQNPDTGEENIAIFVHSRHAEVFYLASATVGPGASIEADLGIVGRIDVDFAPSGGPRVERSACGDKSVPLESGFYEGSIEFEGEEGYSEVHATAARGDVRLLMRLLCPGGPTTEGIGGHFPGAQLTAKHRGSRRFEFSAMKNSPSRPARFTAWVSEHRGSLFISRGVETTAGPDTFDFDVPSGIAHVSPPKPFSGEASYLRPSGKRSSWHGDLSVDFPGRSNFRLTGPGTRSNLIRAALNPGFPFLIP